MAENNSPQPTINVPPLAQRPVLKESCDVAIQTAFHESNWNLAYNLAKQRSKSTKDPYYAVSEGQRAAEVHRDPLHPDLIC